MASRFGAHIKVWFLLVPVLALAVMPAIPDRTLFEIPAEETESLTAAIGSQRVDDATRSANQLFRKSFVDNGFLRRTLAASGNARGLNDGTATFARSWTENFWLLVYRMMYRAMVMKFWLVGTAFFSLAMFVDGTARRKIKASAAGFVSPLSFHLAGHGLLVVLGTLFGVLVVPLAVVATYWVVVGALLGCLLWKSAESFQSSR